MVPEDHLEFLNTLWSRRPLFTYIFLGANILIFLLMVLAGGSTNQLTLMAFGVKHNAEIANGQWWRFITPIFIHIGLLHLFFNSYALWIVGPQVERLYGPARFVILYLLTGVAGVYGSFYYHPFTISAGASGAIFGLFGVLLVFGLRYRDSIPPSFKRAVGTGVLPVIVINLIIGFTIPAIDNSAHIAGLLSGAALAAVVPFQRPGDETPGIFRTLQMALLAVVLVCFYEVGINYNGPRLSFRNVGFGFMPAFRTGSVKQDFINTVQNAQTVFESSAGDLASGRLDDLGALKSATTKSIDQLRKIRSVSKMSDAIAAALLRVMQDQYELIENVERSGTMTLSHSRQLKDNVRIYARVRSEFSNWMATEGRGN